MDDRIDPPGDPLFAIVNLSDIMTAVEPDQSYVIQPYLPCGHVTLLGAHGGTGKTLLALTWAAHCASGMTWEGFTMNGGRTIFLSLEDDGRMIRRRLRRIIATFGLDAQKVVENLIVLDGTSADGALVRDVIAPGARSFGPTRAYDELCRIAAGAKFVVIDSASDAFDGNENERRTVRQFIRLLAQLARVDDACVLISAHIDKAAARDGSKGNTYSGNTAWHNSVRSRIAMTMDNDGAKLVHEKNSIGRKAKPIELRWDESGLLVVDSIQQVSSEHTLEQLRSDAAAMLDAFKAAAISSASVPSARTGSYTARQTLATFGLPPTLADASGKTRFWAALDFLVAEKCAAFENYSNDQRKKRSRIVLTEGAQRLCAAPSPIPPSAIGAPLGAPLRQPAPQPSAQTLRNAAQRGADDYRRAKDGE